MHVHRENYSLSHGKKNKLESNQFLTKARIPKVESTTYLEAAKIYLGAVRKNGVIRTKYVCPFIYKIWTKTFKSLTVKKRVCFTTNRINIRIIIGFILFCFLKLKFQTLICTLLWIGHITHESHQAVDICKRNTYNIEMQCYSYGCSSVGILSNAI